MSFETSLQPWPVRVTALGDAVAGTRAFRTQGKRRVTVVVKATFAIVPGEVMQPAPSTPLVLDDAHQGGRPTQSLLAAGELALRLPHVDIWLTGHAHAPPGQAVTSTLVRLIVGGEGKLLVNKSIRVQGDWSEERGELTPFQYMPLTYERALGGRGSEDNPAGVGLEPGASPNLLDPRGRPIAACFAPLPRGWPVRNRLLGAFDPGELDEPSPAIPEDFDWTYFHAAPADQRVEVLRGDEVIILDGMHRTLARVEAKLPSARAEARLYGPTKALAAGQPIALRVDTLGIDVNRMAATLLFRGEIEAEGLDLDAIEVLAGVALPGRPIAWPAWPSEPAAVAPPGGTIQLRAADIARRFAAMGLPYEREAPEPEPDSLTRPFHRADLAPASVTRLLDTSDLVDEPAPRVERPAEGAGQTLDLRAEAMARRKPEDALPFHHEADTLTRVMPQTGPTVTLRPEDVARLKPEDALPFVPAPEGGQGAFIASAPRVERVERPAVSAGQTLDLRAEAVARRRPEEALPFNVGRGSTPPPPAEIEAPPMMSPPPVVSPPPLLVAPMPASPPPPEAPPPTGMRATLLGRIAAREPLLDLDLAGADLRGIDLAGAALARVNLTGADLRGAKLAGARLSHAQLADADLSGADLSGADLGEADLSRATLARATLDDAVLTGAILAGARGPGASFVGANAGRASFARGEWDEARFTRVAAAGADFSAASIAGARFEGATLDGARFDDARGAGAVFDGAHLSRARAAGASLVGASLRGVDAPGSIWEKATLDRAVFAEAILKEANLSRANALGASFAKATLDSANLQRLTGDGADLRGAHLDSADLRQARLHAARFDGATLRTLAASKADLTRCRFDRADLTSASLRGAKLVGASLAHGKLDGADLLDADLAGVNVFGASRKTAKLGAGARGLIEVDPGPEDLEGDSGG